MSGTFADYQVHQWLQEIADGAYVSLHYDDPSLDGLGGSEIYGGGYTRARVDFTQPDNRTIWSLTDAIFSGLTQNRLTHFGVWVDQYQGLIRAHGPLPAEVLILNGQGYVVKAGTLALSIS